VSSVLKASLRQQGVPMALQGPSYAWCFLEYAYPRHHRMPYHLKNHMCVIALSFKRKAPTIWFAQVLLNVLDFKDINDEVLC
jgi:hypothetical protein